MAIILILIAFPSFKCAPYEVSSNTKRRNGVGGISGRLTPNNAPGEPNKMSGGKAVAESPQHDGLPRHKRGMSGENTTRMTNPDYTRTGYRRPFSSKQNMTAEVRQLADGNSLSAVSSPEGGCHRYVGKQLCGGLNSQINTGRWSLRDLTASGTSGDGLIILAWQAKGRSLGRSRAIHSSHNLEASEPKNVREDVSVGAWLELELGKRRGKSGKFRKLIDILSNTDFLIACYGLIKGKPGNMTPGSDPRRTTLDGINLAWFRETAEKVGKDKFTFSPTREREIPKPNGKMRVLGIGSPREKIVQKALEMVLSRIWEPMFSESSHGYRPSRSIKTALFELFKHGNNYTWVIQGDISKCFDRIPHDVILREVAREVGCERTIRLIRKMLSSGTKDLRTGTVKYSKVGTPQGNVVSPVLANIVLNRLDKFVEGYKAKFEKGRTRKMNRKYISLRNRRNYTADVEERKRIWQEMRTISAVNRHDPGFKRMMYLRYADDFVILITGTLKEAVIIKRRVRDYLKSNTGLELSDEKTAITPTRLPFKFLGASCKRTCSRKQTRTRRGISKRTVPRMRLDIPTRELMNKYIKNGFCSGSDSPRARRDLTNLDHNDIIMFYNSTISGLVEFYDFARNYSALHRYIWLLRGSCSLTLALKYKLRTMRKAFSKFGRTLDSIEGVGLKIPKTLRQKLNFGYSRSRVKGVLEGGSWAYKVTKSNLFKSCLICGSTNQVEMHHVRSVKDVRHKMRTGDSTYEEWVGAMRRKQVPLCQYHHRCLHGGQLLHSDLKRIAEFVDQQH